MPKREKPKFERKERHLNGHEKIRRSVHRVSVEEDNGMTDERCYQRIRQVFSPLLDIVTTLAYLSTNEWTEDLIKKNPHGYKEFITMQVVRAKEVLAIFKGERKFRDKEYYAKWKKQLALSLFKRNCQNEREIVLQQINTLKASLANARETSEKNWLEEEIEKYHEKLDEIDAREKDTAVGEGYLETSMDDGFSLSPTPRRNPPTIRRSNPLRGTVARDWEPDDENEGEAYRIEPDAQMWEEPIRDDGTSQGPQEGNNGG